MSEVFNISELEDVYTEQSLIQEATAKPTVRKGDYNWTVKNVTPKIAGDRSPFPGRKQLSLQLSTTLEDGKQHTMFQEVSWELYREAFIAGERVLVKPGDEGYDKSLKMDKPSRLWAQLEKVFNPSFDKDIKEVIGAINGSQVGGYVVEGLKNDAKDMQWIDVKENDYSSLEEYHAAYDEAKKELIQRGYAPVNFLTNFHAVKV